MPWWFWVLLVAGSLLLGAVALLLVRWLGKREPYDTFISLRARRKLTFFRLMLQDDRVPLYVKAIPLLLAIYLTSPIDIIPDFIPVVGYLDDMLIVLLALVLIMKLTSRPVIQDLIQRARASDAPA